MGTTSSLMSFAEFERLPDAPGKQELIDGEVISMPPPEYLHSVTAKRLFLMLLKHLNESRVWHDHTGYRIAGGWIEPDVSVSWPDQRRDGKYFLGAPMIAVEVLSPGEEIERKLTLYFEEGAAGVWVVDPRRRTLTVYDKSPAGTVTRTPIQTAYRAAALGAEIPVAGIFE